VEEEIEFKDVYHVNLNHESVRSIKGIIVHSVTEVAALE
jgi:hypothetical protein